MLAMRKAGGIEGRVESLEHEEEYQMWPERQKDKRKQ